MKIGRAAKIKDALSISGRKTLDDGVIGIDLAAIPDATRYARVRHYGDGKVEWEAIKDSPAYAELKRLSSQYVNRRSGLKTTAPIKVEITASECNEWLRSLPPVPQC